MTIGSNTKFGRIIKVCRDGVICEDKRGDKRKVSFKRFKDHHKHNKHLAA